MPLGLSPARGLARLTRNSLRAGWADRLAAGVAGLGRAGGAEGLAGEVTTYRFRLSVHLSCPLLAAAEACRPPSGRAATTAASGSSLAQPTFTNRHAPPFQKYCPNETSRFPVFLYQISLSVFSDLFIFSIFFSKERNKKDFSRRQCGWPGHSEHDDSMLRGRINALIMA